MNLSLFPRMGYKKLNVSELSAEQLNAVHCRAEAIYRDRMTQINPQTTFAKYIKDTRFEPVCAFYGDDILSYYYGKCIIYAITDGRLFCIEFHIHSVGLGTRAGKWANRINEIRNVIIWESPEGEIAIETPDPADEESYNYGWGALWVPGPTVETDEQKNLYALARGLKKWSVSEQLNMKFKEYERRPDIKPYVLDRREKRRDD